MSRFLLAAGALALGALPASADNWPQWPGPKNDAHPTEKNIPPE